MSFDVATYLDARPSQLHQVVEIGHGPLPMAVALPEGVEYVGYDTYKRAPEAIKHGVAEEKALRPDAIFVRLEPDQAPPLGNADEVVISNVLGDTKVVDEWDETYRVLQGAAGAAGAAGIIVVRETYTPAVAFLGSVLGALRRLFPNRTNWIFESLRDRALGRAGLMLLAQVSGPKKRGEVGPELWQRLESAYNPYNAHRPKGPYGQPFYLFLGKTAHDGSPE